MIERVERCQHLTWDVGEQVLRKKGNVVLDIGFMTKAKREYVFNKAKVIGASVEVHYNNAPINFRKQHVTKRNSEKDRSVYSREPKRICSLIKIGSLIAFLLGVNIGCTDIDRGWSPGNGSRGRMDDTRSLSESC